MCVAHALQCHEPLLRLLLDVVSGAIGFNAAAAAAVATVTVEVYGDVSQPAGYVTDEDVYKRQE